MALAPFNILPRVSSSASSCLSSPFFQNPRQFKTQKAISKSRRKMFCITACSTSTPQSSPIFLPLLTTSKKLNQNIELQDDAVDDIDDPILKFFKSRVPVPDPSQEGRISLQKNRKTSWHLAPTFSDNESDSEPGTVTDNCLIPLSNNEVDGVVGEILEIARTLPENVTIGEALEQRDVGGKLEKEECVEVLRLLGEEGNLMGCLYFFEWMGLREPCLVSPRACSVLFPILGQAGKGDALLLVFRNLPFKKSKEFRDVHVYNSAISGLLLCGR